MDSQLVGAIAAIGILILGGLKFAYDLGKDVGGRDRDP